MAGRKAVNAVSSYYENKYAAKSYSEIEDLLKSFKHVVTSDWQLNDVQADSENYKLKKLVCTCQMLANLANESNDAASSMFNVLACRY